MSEGKDKAPGPRAVGPARWMSGPSVERAQDVRGTLRRLVALMRPERALVIAVVLLAAGRVATSVWAP
ncbi:MAG: hypothetical protein ACRDNS_07750, partial [Trebonia sp.]